PCLLGRGQLRVGGPLERVDRGPIRPARRERRLPGRSQPAGEAELRDLGHVDRAPDAPRAAWRQADDPAITRHAPPDAVDPADTERLLDDLLPGQRWPGGRLLP